MTMNVFHPIGSVRSARVMSMRTTSTPGPNRSRVANSSRSSITVTSYSSSVARLDLDPHRASTNEAGVPGEVLGQLVFAERRAACLDNPLRLDERVAFDASTAQSPRQTAQIVDDELRTDHLRRAPDGPDDGADGESAPLALELGHLRVDLAHAPSIGPSEPLTTDRCRVNQDAASDVSTDPTAAKVVRPVVREL